MKHQNKIPPQTQNLEDDTKHGFTIIEVMLVLGLTGLLLVGLLGGTFSAIKAQRYNDSVRSFAEYLRTIYSEVLSPESLGQSDAEKLGNQGQAILGKVLVFGGNGENDTRVYSATLVGNASLDIFINNSDAGGFINELGLEGVQTSLLCGDAAKDQPSTVSNYLPLWEAELMQINDTDKGFSTRNRFKGTVIIARSPSSGVVHTIFTPDTYNLVTGCQPGSDSASNNLRDDLHNNPQKFSYDSIGFCVKSDNASFMREVRLAEDGRNTSAVSILNVDQNDNGVENRCR